MPRQDIPLFEKANVSSRTGRLFLDRFSVDYDLIMGSILAVETPKRYRGRIGTNPGKNPGFKRRTPLWITSIVFLHHH